MSIFLDANIIFSGSNKNSDMHYFLNWLHDKRQLVTSAYVLEEAQRNILAKREQWYDGYQLVMRFIKIIPDKPLNLNVDLADKDRPVLSAVIAGNCEYLVTGDKRDFGHLYNKTIKGVTIIDYVTLAHLMLEHYSS